MSDKINWKENFQFNSSTCSMPHCCFFHPRVFHFSTHPVTTEQLLSKCSELVEKKQEKIFNLLIEKMKQEKATRKNFQYKIFMKLCCETLDDFNCKLFPPSFNMVFILSEMSLIRTVNIFQSSDSQC